jgi:hypothetical protein
MPLPTHEQLEKARLQAEQARARYQALQARFSQAARKLDMRRKIILGGLLLDAAQKDERFAKVVSALLQRVERDHDRKAFDGWTPPAPDQAATPAASVSAPEVETAAPIPAEPPASP